MIRKEERREIKQDNIKNKEFFKKTTPIEEISF